MSKMSKHNKSFGNHYKFLKRIKKTLYYGKLPTSDQLSLPLTEIAAELFSEPRTGRSLERLHCREAAATTRNACISPCSLVVALLYLERLSSCNQDYLQTVLPSELFLVSLLVSNKFLNDEELYLDEWLASNGVTAKQLVQLEREFLEAIEWKVYVTESEFWDKLLSIERVIATKQSLSRGFCTYTDLISLLESGTGRNLFLIVANVIVISTVAYSICVLVMVGAVIGANYTTAAVSQSISSHIDNSYRLANRSEIINQTESSTFTQSQNELILTTNVTLQLRESEVVALPALNIFPWKWLNNKLQQYSWLSMARHEINNFSNYPNMYLQHSANAWDCQFSKTCIQRSCCNSWIGTPCPILPIQIK